MIVVRGVVNKVRYLPYVARIENFPEGLRGIDAPMVEDEIYNG